MLVDRKIIFPGTKQSYDGPMELVEAIRVVLSDKPPSKKLPSQNPDGPGDNPPDDSSTFEAQSKSDDDMEVQRRKIP